MCFIRIRLQRFVFFIWLILIFGFLAKRNGRWGLLSFPISLLETTWENVRRNRLFFFPLFFFKFSSLNTEADNIPSKLQPSFFFFGFRFRFLWSIVRQFLNYEPQFWTIKTGNGLLFRSPPPKRFLLPSLPSF